MRRGAVRPGQQICLRKQHSATRFHEPQWRQESVVEVKERQSRESLLPKRAVRVQWYACTDRCSRSYRIGVRGAQVPVDPCHRGGQSSAFIPSSPSHLLPIHALVASPGILRLNVPMDLPRPLSPVCWHAQAHSAATCSACQPQTSPSPSRGVMVIADADQHAWRQAKRQRRRTSVYAHAQSRPPEATAAPSAHAQETGEICPQAEERSK